MSEQDKADLEPIGGLRNFWVAIRGFFAPPSFEDQDKLSQAYMLNFVSLLFLSVLFIGIPVAFIVAWEYVTVEVIPYVLFRTVPLIIPIAIAQVLLRRGYVRLGSIVFSTFLWLAFIYMMFMQGGIQSTSYPDMMFIILLFGLLVGVRPAIGVMVVSILIGGVAVIMQRQGLLPEPWIGEYNMLDWITYSFVFMNISGLLYLFIRGKDQASALAKQAYSELEEAGRHLEQRVVERTRALEVSTEIGRRLSTILDGDQLVREVVEQLRAAYGFYHVHIYLLDEAKAKLVMMGGTGEVGQTLLASGHILEKGQGLVGRAAESAQPVLITDVSQEAGWLPNPLLPETRSELAVPIALGGEVLGVLDVQQDMREGFGQEDVYLLQSIASQVAIALQNAQAYASVQKQAEREAQLAAINQRIQAATTVDDALQVAISELGQTLGAKLAAVELSLPDEMEALK